MTTLLTILPRTIKFNTYGNDRRLKLLELLIDFKIGFECYYKEDLENG